LPSVSRLLPIEELVVLEAMKMESPIYAPTPRVPLSAILVKEGDAVSEGQVLSS
jgi:biotin carboxyl carrier protein